MIWLALHLVSFSLAVEVQRPIGGHGGHIGWRQKHDEKTAEKLASQGLSMADHTVGVQIDNRIRAASFICQRVSFSNIEQVGETNRAYFSQN